MSGNTESQSFSASEEDKLLTVLVFQVLLICHSYPGTSPEHVKDHTQGNNQHDD